MHALEQLFRLEIEFHRMLRCDAPGTSSVAAPHTSYALQNGYEPLLIGLSASVADVERMKNRLLLAGNLHDVFSAADSVKRILGLFPYDK